MSPPLSGVSVSPRSTVPLQFGATPFSLPAPIVMITSEPWIVLAMIRLTTGGILMLSQLGLFGSGCFGSGHLGNFGGVHFLTRRSGGLGQSMVAWHAAR